MNREDLEKMDYGDLRDLAKEKGINARKKNAIIKALLALEEDNETQVEDVTNDDANIADVEEVTSDDVPTPPPIYNKEDIKGYVNDCYRYVLERDADPGGLRTYVKHIKEKKIKPEDLIGILKSSDEYKKLKGSQ